MMTAGLVMTITKKKILPGTLVMVSYPLEDGQINNPAMKLEGKVFTVKRKCNVMVGRVRHSYYELYGAVSDMGVPYGFLENELTVVSEVTSCH